MNLEVKSRGEGKIENGIFAYQENTSINGKVGTHYVEETIKDGKMQVAQGWFTPSDRITVKSWIEGPRFAGIPGGLKILACELDLEIKSDVEKRWLREQVVYEITGHPDNIERFNRSLTNIVSRINK